jgi:YVTN family beta-propeller protein
MSDISISSQGNLSIGEFVGRDKIVNNIQNIQNILQQRVLTAAEEADSDRALESKQLVAGVTTFMQRLQARADEGREADAGNPYKGLLEYRLGDADLFFGRQRAISELMEQLRGATLTALHAESGTGKSSLLQAGVSPRLIAAGHLPVYLRPYNVNPSLAIKRTFLADLSLTPFLATAPLRAFLQQVTGLLGPKTTLYIFLDQFEEFFSLLEEPARAEFIGELAECVEDQTLNVRWLLGMRTETFGNLSDFRPRIRNPYESDYALYRLTRDEAREVISQPAAKRGVQYEAGLIDKILDDLDTSKEAKSGVNALNPPEIQLVCSALYAALPAGEKTITQAMYEAKQGVAGILRTHLDDVLSHNLSPEQRPIAQWALEALITSDNHRILRPLSDLAAELAPRGVKEAQLREVLEQLVTSHLVRVEEKTPDAPQYEAAAGMSHQQVTQLAYELAHEYLLGRITLDPAVQSRKAAQELVMQEMTAYRNTRTLINDDRLAIIMARRSELALSDEAKELISKSERAFRRKRGFLLGGIGLIIVLFIIGLASTGLMVAAQNERTVAVARKEEAQATAVQAATLASDALSQQRTSLAAQATAEIAAQSAAAQASAAEAEAAQAVARADKAKAVVRGLFDNNGLVPTDGGPWGLVFANGLLWVSDETGNTVQGIDPATGVVSATIAVGHRPGPLTFDGQRLWVVNQDDSTVEAIDLTTRASVQRVTTPSRAAAILFAANAIWIASANNTVQAILPETGALQPAIAVGSLPWVLASDGQRVWVASRNSNTVQAIKPDPANPLILFTQTLNGTPAGLAFDGNVMWVSIQSRSQVQGLNPETGEVMVKGLTVGLRPSTLVFDGQRLWVANQGDNTVQVVDVVVGTVSAPVPVGQLPRAFAFAGGHVWVANYSDNTIQALDPTVGDVVAQMKVGRTPRGMAFDGKQLWVAIAGEGTVQAIDPASGKVSATITVGVGVRDITFDGRRLWVVNFTDNTVQSVDPISKTAGLTITVNTGPRAIIYAGGLLWIANGVSNTVQSIDPASGVIKETIAVGKAPFDLTYDGAKIWVVNNGDNAVQAIVPGTGKAGVSIRVGSGGGNPGSISFDGQRIWVTNFFDGDVQAIDPQTGHSEDPIRVGGFPVELAWDGTNLWVVNFGDNTVQAVDVKTGATSRPYHVGAGPSTIFYDGHGRVWVANRDSNSVQYVVVNR